MGIPARGQDGYFHPSSEAELQALVRHAHDNGLQIRVRGSGHSCAKAIYTDPTTEDGIKQEITAPDGPYMNVMLDKYVLITDIDPENLRITVQSGIHLSEAPHDPTGTATLESGLLYQLDKLGWTVNDLGGITHQTISGFLMTGSAGGSMKYDIGSNVYGMRIIDGTGQVHEVSRDQDPEKFFAMGISMGLCGVVSEVTLQCVPMYAIGGQESITTLEECDYDLFSNEPEDDRKVGLRTFLEGATYTRFLWWPQPGAERVTTWQAQRIEIQPGFRAATYEQFGKHAKLTNFGIALFYTFIGNLDDLSAAKDKLEPAFDEFVEMLQMMLEADGKDWYDKAASIAIAGAAELGIDAVLTALQPFTPILKRNLPELMGWALGVFVPLDSDKEGRDKGEPQLFQDKVWKALPMDNEADDVLLGTWFTELFIPIQHGARAMALLRDWFYETDDGHEILKRTGTYSWEMYAATPSEFWMSMSYSNGSDDWKDGCFRIDPFWYAENEGDPVEFFEPVWKLMRDNGIPYRLHWGKFWPRMTEVDEEGWVPFFKGHFEKWDAFLALRKQMDPNNIFLTSYWRGRFGLWDEPLPAAGDGEAGNAT